MSETNEKNMSESDMLVLDNGGNGGNEGNGDGEKLKKLDDYLKNMVDITYQIHDICYEKLEEVYEKEKIVLPIRIEMVAEKMGIKYEYGSLDLGMNDRINHEIAQLRIEEAEEEEEEAELKIIVDNTYTRKQSGELSDLEKYAVAYELGKVIINRIKIKEVENICEFNMDSMPYSLPKLPARLENFKYELCAIFLLLPLNLFFDEFEKYLEEIDEQPVLMDKWFHYLSNRASIPMYQLINGYQYIKFCAYQYYQEKMTEENKESERLRKLFNL